jgi:hypothetical protein
MAFSNENRNFTIAPCRAGGRRYGAIVIALAALGTVAAVWFWTTLLAVPVALLSWQNGVMVGGCGIFCIAALVALGLEDLLEWLWAALAAIAAVIIALFWGVLSLLGWD